MNIRKQENRFTTLRRRLTTELRLQKKPLVVNPTTWHVGAFHAALMLIALAILLGVVYTQQQPYHYTASQYAFKVAMRYEDAEQVTDLDGIWTWLQSVTRSIPSETTRQVEVFCAVQDPHRQVVVVDGINYTFHNPELQRGNCQGIEYITGTDPVYITGNDQILSFGIFTERSPQKLSKKKSIGSHGRMPIRSEMGEKIDPSWDDKVLELCTMPGQDGHLCVSKDGFSGDPGSTLHWDGAKVDGVYAFNASQGVMFRALDGQYTFQPCYTYTEDDSGNKEATYTGNSSFAGPDNCGLTWVVPADHAYQICLDKKRRQQTAIDALIASFLGMATYDDTIDAVTGCALWEHMPRQDLQSSYVEGIDFFNTYLATQKIYGSFFNATNELSWIVDSYGRQIMLQYNHYFDDNTRVVKVYTVTRNVGDNELFYALLEMSFHISTTGGISVEFDVTYSPIIQYFYGLDGYEWLFREVFILEVLLLIVFVLFTARESMQLVQHVLKMSRNFREVAVAPGEQEDSMRSQQLVDLEEGGSLQLGSAQNLSSLEVSADKSSGSMVGKYQLSDEEEEEKEKEKSDKRHDQVQVLSQLKEKPPSGKSSDLPHPSLPSRSVSEVFKTFVDDVAEMIPDMEDVKDILPDDVSWMDVFDWVMIFIVLSGIIYRVLYIQHTRALHLYLVGLDSMSPNGRQYDSHLDDIIAKFEEISDIHTSLKLIVLLSVFSGLVQFFKYVSFDTRLGIFTTTMGAAAKDLAPIMVLFMVVVLTFATLGTEIYGQYLEEWSSLGKSLSSLFLLVLGEFGGYFDMHDVSPLETALFFWAYVVIILFILFNMVLAVIFTVYDEKYDEVKAKSS